jgi:hypothetical protein
MMFPVFQIQPHMLGCWKDAVKTSRRALEAAGGFRAGRGYAMLLLRQA